MLKIENLTYTYADSNTKSLDSISMQVEEGEFVAVIGANNSGKSTLCNAIAGVIPHLYHGEISGKVWVQDKDSFKMSVSEIAMSVGLVMQDPVRQLSGVRYTVFEEVAFSLENRGVERSKMKEQVDNVLNMIGLAELSDRPPYQLSGGQQQKVALASVMACDPSILVLDEATTFLDPQGVLQIFEIMLRLKKNGKTIVMADQHLEWVAKYADRVVVMNSGKIVMQGTPAEVLTSPLIKEIGLDWTRYTHVASLAKTIGIWSNASGLGITFEEVVDGLTLS
ncbi:energy-coupling factor ABC transporter ATP-binding protein [Maridesulfovibrio zosterae]|uniref:energy-coupling factor ABC transporter ATP-binding protein n=1 Tax=Maridesulfovibrio zosterae TaxID=82171 RepID=UPI001FE02555|nr:ABC transporter ATP-binding protein [Maridesulfovibrio zosterae]